MSITIWDSTDELFAMTIDEAIRNLSETSAGKLICEVGEDDKEQLPSIFESFKFKTYGFRLQLTRRAALTKEYNFVITDVSHTVICPATVVDVEATPPPVTPAAETLSEVSTAKNKETQSDRPTAHRRLVLASSFEYFTFCLCII